MILWPYVVSPVLLVLGVCRFKFFEILMNAIIISLALLVDRKKIRRIYKRRKMVEAFWSDNYIIGFSNDGSERFGVGLHCMDKDLAKLSVVVRNALQERANIEAANELVKSS